MTKWQLKEIWERERVADLRELPAKGLGAAEGGGGSGGETDTKEIHKEKFSLLWEGMPKVLWKHKIGAGSNLPGEKKDHYVLRALKTISSNILPHPESKAYSYAPDLS